MFFSINLKVFSKKLVFLMLTGVIVSERERNRLAETEGGELYGAIFFPKENC